MKNIKMPLMAPQLLQDKAPNPNLAFEALHSPVSTAPSSLTSLYAPVAQPQPGPALEFGFMLSVFSLLPSVPLPGQVPALSLVWAQPSYLLPLPVHSLCGIQSDHYYISDHFLPFPNNILSHMQ